MKWRIFAWLGLALLWPSVSCTGGREHARIIGEEPAAPDASSQGGWVYYRTVPAHFRELQWRACTDLPESVRRSYEAFRYRSAYPCVVESWCSPAVLHENGPCHVHINLASQRGILLVNGRLALDFPVCTGAASHPTPIGDYQILEKDARHRSNLYDNAPMYCFMRLTWDGVGLHIGPLEGVPSSHGCIRLPADSCRKLFSRLPEGTPVTISP